MTFRVQLFARARDLAGAATVAVELPEGATVGDLRRRLGMEHTSLASLLPRSALAVNDEFAEDEEQLPRDAEIALLPPVSGGSSPLASGMPS
jgi:molybdopterin converting factor subunit 1